jgi:predicted nucleic acid-binding protein
MEAAIAKFLDQTLLQFDVIYPDKPILALAGEINATLALGGRSIGVVDCLIAATAITQKITLVNANTKHFARVVQAGYPLDVTNWRIS